MFRIATEVCGDNDPADQQATLLAVGHSTCWRLVEAVLRGRRHDPLDEPTPPPLTVLEHPRDALELLRGHL